jgi:hypothetical protein
MNLAQIFEEEIKKEGITKLNKRQKEAFLKQYYFDQAYEVMSMDEIKAALKMDGILSDQNA